MLRCCPLAESASARPNAYVTIRSGTQPVDTYAVAPRPIEFGSCAARNHPRLVALQSAWGLFGGSPRRSRAICEHLETVLKTHLTRNIIIVCLRGNSHDQVGHHLFHYLARGWVLRLFRRRRRFQDYCQDSFLHCAGHILDRACVRRHVGNACVLGKAAAGCSRTKSRREPRVRLQFCRGATYTNLRHDYRAIYAPIETE
jgi:hypothetical protein